MFRESPGEHRHGLLGQGKWFAFDSLSNTTASDALNANFHSFGTTAREFYLDSLQVGAKLSPRNACDFGTDTTQVFGLTARFNLVANLCRLTTNFTFT